MGEQDTVDWDLLHRRAVAAARPWHGSSFHDDALQEALIAAHANRDEPHGEASQVWWIRCRVIDAARSWTGRPVQIQAGGRLQEGGRYRFHRDMMSLDAEWATNRDGSHEQSNGLDRSRYELSGGCEDIGSIMPVVDGMRLNDRERHIVLARIAGFSQAAIGAQLGVTESRVCQLITKIKERPANRRYLEDLV